MLSTYGYHRLIALFLGMLLAQSMVAWAQNPDPVGKKQIIESIRFEGVKDLNAEALRSKLGLKEKGAYDEDTLNSDARIIESSLHDQGYVYAKTQDVRGELVKPDRLILTFVIDSGDIYHIAEVKVVGNLAFPSRVFAARKHLTVGQLYVGSDVIADEKMLTDFYGARGYADVTVETSLLEVSRDSVQIQYEITEGKISLLQDIHISGNAKVKEEVIRNEFKLVTGDVFNTVLIEQGRQALLRMGLFETVEVSKTAAAKPGFKTLEVSVLEK